jgi:hypothetical protein
MPHGQLMAMPLAVMRSKEGSSGRAINPFLRINWRPLPHFAKALANVEWGNRMSPETLNSVFSLLIGFAFAGALASGYQVLVDRPPGFGLLGEGAAPRAFAAVPFLVFAAPFIIMRNTVRGRRIEQRRVEFVMMATVLAGVWSLMSGTCVLMVLHAAGIVA